MLSKAAACHDAERDKVVQLFLEKNWVGFIADYFQELYKAENWSSKFVTVAIENLVKGLEVLQEPIRKSAPAVACHIYDAYFSVMYDNINHPTMIKEAESPSTSVVVKLIRGSLETLQNFILSPDIRDSKIDEETKSKVTQLFKKYIGVLRNTPYISAMCHRSLNFLEKDESPYPQLPLAYLAKTLPSSDNLDDYVDNVSYIVRRLTSVSIESHKAMPWRYQHDFGYGIWLLFVLY